MILEFLLEFLRVLLFILGIIMFHIIIFIWGIYLGRLGVDYVDELIKKDKEK